MSEKEYTPFVVNHKKVMQTKKYLATTRLLAAHFSDNQYLTIGEFLTDLSSDDLEALLEMIEEKEIDELILISEMLALGEGLDNSDSDEVVMNRMNMLSNYLVIESLARKNMVKIYRENMSFGDDYDNKIVVEKL